MQLFEARKEAVDATENEGSTLRIERTVTRAYAKQQESEKGKGKTKK